MNRIKTIWLALVAVFAFSAVAATVATAVEGHFTRLVEVGCCRAKHGYC
jgi:hypothetical protein